jgi:hypothetical protein
MPTLFGEAVGYYNVLGSFENFPTQGHKPPTQYSVVALLSDKPTRHY